MLTHESHKTYFSTTYSLTSERVNGYPYYTSDKYGGKYHVKHCLFAWMFGSEDKDEESCRGSFYVQSDEKCVQNVPSENWKFTLDQSADNEWFDVNSPIKVECFEEGILL